MPCTLPLLVLLAACVPARQPAAPATAEDTGAAPDSADTGDVSIGEDVEMVDTGADVVAELGCPPEMVAVRDLLGEPVYCIDIFESTFDDGALGERDQGAGYPDGSTAALAQSVEGTVPTTVVSWYQAVAACLNAGKHLCSSEEWQDACDGTIGDGGLSYPWGDDWSEGTCALPGEGGVPQHEALLPTGSLEGCVSPAGAHDMSGNAWEWSDPMVSDEAGVPVTDKRGGAYYSGRGNAGCASALLGEHPPEFSGTIAARCCATPSAR